jgi:hypothetical protein
VGLGDDLECFVLTSTNFRDQKFHEILPKHTPRLLFAGSWRKSSSVTLGIFQLITPQNVPFYAVSIDGVADSDVKRALTVHVIYIRRLFNKSLVKLTRRQNKHCDVADCIAMPALLYSLGASSCYNGWAPPENTK